MTSIPKNLLHYTKDMYIEGIVFGVELAAKNTQQNFEQKSFASFEVNFLKSTHACINELVKGEIENDAKNFFARKILRQRLKTIEIRRTTSKHNERNFQIVFFSISAFILPSSPERSHFVFDVASERTLNGGVSVWHYIYSARRL